MKRWLACLLLCMMLSGCSSDSVSDRLYLQSLHICGNAPLTLTMQAFDHEEQFSASGDTLSEALQIGEAMQGGRIFTGHTELLMIGAGFRTETAEELLVEQGLSPACKILYGASADSERTIRNLRMAEQNGILPVTELSTAIREWLGSGETALLPAADGNGMCLLGKDGRMQPLSEEAVRGFCWLRENTGSRKFSVNGERADILRSKRSRSREGDGCKYTIRVFIEQDDRKEAVQKQIEKECRAAVTEMLAAHADVIGAEESTGIFPTADNFSFVVAVN